MLGSNSSPSECDILNSVRSVVIALTSKFDDLTNIEEWILMQAKFQNLHINRVQHYLKTSRTKNDLHNASLLKQNFTNGHIHDFKM